MSRLVTRAVRLVKFGAVAGALVGVGQLVLKRRRQSEMTESSWPTIAETAAENGQPVDDETDGSSPEASVEADDADADAGEETKDEA